MAGGGGFDAPAGRDGASCRRHPPGPLWLCRVGSRLLRARGRRAGADPTAVEGADQIRRSRPVPRSIGVGTDDLASRLRGYGPPGLLADAVLDEPDGAV